MIRKNYFLFFIFIVTFDQQNAMYRATGSLFKKNIEQSLFTERFLKALNAKSHTSNPNSISILSQLPLEDDLMNSLRFFSKGFHTNVVLLVNKMVWLNQKKSIDVLRNYYIDVKYLPDEHAKYQVTQDDAGNIVDIKVSKDIRALVDQVALVSYDQNRVIVSSTNSSAPIIEAKKSADPIGRYITQRFFDDFEKQFDELHKKSKK